ncbi:hypothetical protein ACP2W0_18515 [Pseudobacillus badius]|uniref:hypothetical protein n=1 Tax=Bacillus badius TaxID=1455 RepID=UPI003CF086EB
MIVLLSFIANKVILSFLNDTLFFYKGKYLYDWLGDTSFVDEFIDGLLKDSKKEGYFLDNLKIIKEKMKQRNYSMVELQLLKAYFMTAEKSFAAVTFMTAIIAFMSGLSLQILKNPIDQFFNSTMSQWDGLDAIVIIGVTFVNIVVFITKIYKRYISRLVMMKEIIEICIEEKKNGIK